MKSVKSSKSSSSGSNPGQITTGAKAPLFALKDKDGKTHSLSEVSSKYTVVFFYPKDDTPGCTIEAREISAALSKFAKAGVTVFGISGGDARSKAKFCEKYDLEVTLLSDPDFSVAKAFGSYGEKKFMGRTYLGIMRNTFLIDSSHTVVKVFDGVKPEGHAQELLAAVKNLGLGTDTSSPKKAARKVPSRKSKTAPKVAKTGSKKAAKKVAKKVAKKKATKKVAKKTSKR